MWEFLKKLFGDDEPAVKDLPYKKTVRVTTVDKGGRRFASKGTTVLEESVPAEPPSYLITALIQRTKDDHP